MFVCTMHVTSNIKEVPSRNEREQINITLCNDRSHLKANTLRSFIKGYNTYNI